MTKNVKKKKSDDFNQGEFTTFIFVLMFYKELFLFDSFLEIKGSQVEGSKCLLFSYALRTLWL